MVGAAPPPLGHALGCDDAPVSETEPSLFLLLQCLNALTAEEVRVTDVKCFAEAKDNSWKHVSVEESYIKKLHHYLQRGNVSISTKDEFESLRAFLI
jgi:hypothetical protein